MENLKSDSGIEVTSSRNVDYMTKELEAMRIDREDTDLTASEDSSDEYDTDIEPTDDIKRKFLAKLDVSNVFVTFFLKKIPFLYW